MKRMAVLAVFLAIIGLVVGCMHFQSDWGANRVQVAIESVLMVNMDVKMIVGNNPSEIRKKRFIAFPIGNGHIVALTHCVTPPPHITVQAPFGVVRIPVQIIDIQISISDHPAELVGTHGDVALLYCNTYITPFPFLFGDSDELAPGDKILSIGYSFNEVINVKDGVVSVLKPNGEFNTGTEPCFFHTISTNPGDSGSPVIALTYAGGAQVIGIVNATIPQAKGISMALTSNYVQEAISKILKDVI